MKQFRKHISRTWQHLKSDFERNPAAVDLALACSLAAGWLMYAPLYMR